MIYKKSNYSKTNSNFSKYQDESNSKETILDIFDDDADNEKDDSGEISIIECGEEEELELIEGDEKSVSLQG